MAAAAGPGDALAQLITKPPAVAFLRRLLDESPEKRRSPGLAGCFTKYGIGETDLQDAGWVNYRPEHFDQVRAALASGGHMPQAPRKAGAHPMSAPLQARSDLVAVNSINAGVDLPPGVRFMAMGAQAAAQLPHDVLIACQSALVLQELTSFEWMEEYIRGRKALAIHLGGRGGFPAATATALLRASRAPVLAVVDFDAGGLGTAARLPRLETICMPAWELMEHELASPAKCARSAEHILLHGQVMDDIKHPDVAQAWARLKLVGRLMPAEAFPRARVRDRYPKGQDRQGLVSRPKAAR